MNINSETSAHVNNVKLRYSVEIIGFVPISAYYILTQDCLLGFYFMFAFSLIMNRSEVLPCPKLLPEELPSHVVVSVSERMLGFFQQFSYLQPIHEFLIQCDSK